MGLKYHDEMKDEPLSNLLRKDSIRTENQLMVFSDYSWQYFPDNDRSIGSYIIFDQGEPIDHGTHITGSVAESSAESEYNEACNAGMDLAHFSMLIHELLNKDTDIVTEAATLIILDNKSAVCMAKNGKDTKHTKYIARRVHLVRIGETCKIYKIAWFEGDLKLSDIET